MDRKRQSSHFGCDRISNLPCHVIDDILKHLPLRDVVRTSILSRGWQYKWLTIPYLVFDEEFKNSMREYYNFESIMYQLLAQHKGTIVKFAWWAFVDINSHPLLHVLSRHHVEELTLEFRYSSIHQPISCRLFSLDKLRHLELVNCTLKVPSSFKGFGRLVTLDLHNVLTVPGELKRLISKCPILEHFILGCNYDATLADFEIDAPNLKSFCLYSTKLPAICFKNTSILEEVSIEGFSPGQPQGSQNSLIEFFDPLSAIKKLKLDSSFLEFLSRCGVPKILPENLKHLMVLQFEISFVKTNEVACALCLIRSSPNLQILEIEFWGEGDVLQEQSQGSKSFLLELFSSLSSINKLKLKCDFFEVFGGGVVPQELPNSLSHLMVLQLFDIDFSNIIEVSCVLCLIRSSPNLESLEIESTTSRNSDVQPVARFLKEQHKLKLTLSHLKHVKINCFSGSRPEMEFVKLLLSSATSLKKLELRFSYTIRATKEESEMLKQLERFSRASSKVEIITDRGF